MRKTSASNKIQKNLKWIPYLVAFYLSWTSPIKFHPASYLLVSELSSFSCHEIRVIGKVISRPLTAVALYLTSSLHRKGGRSKLSAVNQRHFRNFQI